MATALICWRPWLVEVASARMATVGAMQEPRLTTPPELVLQRAVVAEQCVVAEAAVTVFDATTSAWGLTA